MLVLVSYDVGFEDPGGPRRLRRIAKACEDFGQRVQYSLFECVVDPGQWTRLKHRLLEEMDAERDSLRFYFLGRTGSGVWSTLGSRPATTPVVCCWCSEPQAGAETPRGSRLSQPYENIGYYHARQDVL